MRPACLLHFQSDGRLESRFQMPFEALMCASIFLRRVTLFLPPLWSSGQSSWLQIQTCGFDSRRYRIFWEVVGVERGPLSYVSTIEELLERKSSGSGLESREYCRRDPSRWPRGTLSPQTLAETPPTSGGRSVGIVRSRTLATEFSLVDLVLHFSSAERRFVTGTFSIQGVYRMS
jgi:hypothetical protein